MLHLEESVYKILCCTCTSTLGCTLKGVCLQEPMLHLKGVGLLEPMLHLYLYCWAAPKGCLLQEPMLHLKGVCLQEPMLRLYLYCWAATKGCLSTRAYALNFVSACSVIAYIFQGMLSVRINTFRKLGILLHAEFAPRNDQCMLSMWLKYYLHAEHAQLFCMLNMSKKM